jgi:hypothetical protein
MKRIRGVVAGLALAAVMFAPRAAEAQVQLGWNSSLSALCLNAGCTQIQFTLSLSGLKPTDNNGLAVPAGIVALNSPGYPTQFTIDIFSGAGVFANAVVTSGGTWTTSLINGALTVSNSQIATPFASAPVTVVVDLTAGGGYLFGYSGLAYLGNTGQCYTSTGALDPTCASNSYRQGDFNGRLDTSVVPEPMTMGLMATGLVGLALVGYRRKKNTQV